MSTSTKARPAAPVATDASLSRILHEGYGPGAWHGPDLKAALAEVTPEQAFWRPAPGRPFGGGGGSPGAGTLHPARHGPCGGTFGIGRRRLFRGEGSAWLRPSG